MNKDIDVLTTVNAFLLNIITSLEAQLVWRDKKMSSFEQGAIEENIRVLKTIKDSDDFGKTMSDENRQKQRLYISSDGLVMRKYGTDDNRRYLIVVDLLKILAEYSKSYTDKKQCFQKILFLRKQWKYLFAASIMDKVINSITPLNLFAERNVKIK